MPGKGTGGGTPFEDMSHEQMLQWLDQAKPGALQAAAQRLTQAAEEIRKIGEELKVRPQYVEWKGEGADAFRTWAGDLANSTLRLGEFSEGAAKWMDQASGAVASAQVSIPRDTKGAQANLDAATAARNDPDAAAVSSKSASELAALAADRERVRLQAAAEMRKLGQTYSWSATQMDGLERPKFPPPPEALQPVAKSRDETEVVSSGGDTASTPSGRGTIGASSNAGSHRAVAEAVAGATIQRPSPEATIQRPSPDLADHVGVQIDTTAVLPQTPSTAPATPPAGPPNVGRSDLGIPQSMDSFPPTLSGGPNRSVNTAGPGRATVGGRPSGLSGRMLTEPVSGRMPSAPASGRAPTSGGTGGNPIGQSRPVTGGRPTMLPGQGPTTGAPGRSPAAGSNGVVGGRPMSPPTSRPAGGLARGAVIGGETAETAGRGAPGPSTGSGVAGTNSRRRAAPSEGRIPGASSANGGIVGGRPQPQQRRPNARSFTQGDSGPVRGQDANGGQTGSSRAGRTGASPNGAQASKQRRNDEQNRRNGHRDH